MGYDNAGNVASMTDPAGNITTRTYDGLNRVLAETTPDRRISSIDGVGAQRNFTCDLRNGDPHRVTQRRNARRPRLVPQQAIDALGALLPAPTHSFDLPDRRTISLVPARSAVASTIVARQMCLAAVLRPSTSASSRTRSTGLTDMNLETAV